MLEAIQHLDESILWWIAQNIRMDWLNPLVSVYTSLGNAGLGFIAVAVLLFAIRKTRWSGATALTAMALGMVVTNLTIKPLVTRARPWVVMDAAPEMGKGRSNRCCGLDGIVPAVCGGAFPHRCGGGNGHWHGVRGTGQPSGPVAQGRLGTPESREMTHWASNRPALAGTHMELAGMERRPGGGVSLPSLAR